MSEQTWDLTYWDGNGNAYRVSQSEGHTARFDFDPVGPGQSSSGLYKGGEPKSGELTADQASAIWECADALADQKDAHAEVRRKGTGSLRLTTDTGERMVVLRRSAVAVFEELLAPFRQ